MLKRTKVSGCRRRMSLGSSLSLERKVQLMEYVDQCLSHFINFRKIRKRMSIPVTMNCGTLSRLAAAAIASSSCRSDFIDTRWFLSSRYLKFRLDSDRPNSCLDTPTIS